MFRISCAGKGRFTAMLTTCKIYHADLGFEDGFCGDPKVKKTMDIPLVFIPLHSLSVLLCILRLERKFGEDDVDSY